MSAGYQRSKRAFDARAGVISVREAHELSRRSEVRRVVVILDEMFEWSMLRSSGVEGTVVLLGHHLGFQLPDGVGDIALVRSSRLERSGAFVGKWVDLRYDLDLSNFVFRQ